jgi:NADH-quinone oxidoreductase subunit N
MDKLYFVLPYAPLSLCVLMGILLLLMQVFVKNSQRHFLNYAALLGMSLVGLSTVLSVKMLGDISTGALRLPMEIKQEILSHYAFLDNFALFFYLLLIVGSFLTILSSSSYLERENLVRGEFFALIFFALSGMMVLVSADHLMTLFIGLEIMSMAVYILVGYQRKSAFSSEGAFKYFLLGAMASAILLYGIALTYGSVGSLDLVDIRNHYATGNMLQPLGAVGMLFLIGGMAFKVAAVPFHTWAADAYQGAPTPVTGFMATLVKTAAFALILKVLGEAFLPLRVQWVEAVALLSALTMFVGNVMAFTQTNFKRMLAYSSIVHTGYLLMGVAALTLQNTNQIRAAIAYYLFIYVFSSLGVFAIISYLSGRGEKRQLISEYAGLSKSHPWVSAALALFMLSFIGVPPLGGFFAKYYLFTETLRQASGDTFMVALVGFAVLNSVLSIAYYLRILSTLYFNSAEQASENEASVEPAQSHQSLALNFVLAVTVLLTFWTGFAPVNLLNIIPGLTPLIAWLQQALV